MGFLSSMRELVAPRSSPAQQAPQDTPAPRPATVPDGPTTGGASNVGGNGLGAQDNHTGPHLNPFWNHIFGGPNEQAGDGRPLDQNHIGTREGWGPLDEGEIMSTTMRNTPYLGDYWQGLSITHDSMRIQDNFLNALTGVTNVGLTGPVMALADAPFRAFGHSMFMDDIDDGHGPLTDPWNAVKDGAGQAMDWTRDTATNAWDWASNTATSAWNSASEGATNAWNSASEGVSNAWSSTKETAGQAWDSISSW